MKKPLVFLDVGRIYVILRKISTCMEIKDQGGIITEYNLNVHPASAHFPMRNRIISGLSDGVLVIEAKSRSGSLIAAELGLEQGRDIFALPGRRMDTFSEGCNNLIKAEL